MRVTLALALTGLLFVRATDATPADPMGGLAGTWSFAGWLAEDPADSLYRAAQSALSSSNYRTAATLFRQLRDKYAGSRYTADTYYWEAFALYRLGGGEGLREARRLLQEQRESHPRAATRGDAATLLTRVEGQLARLGDADAARRVAVAAESAAPSRNGQGGECRDDDDDTRIAALNALLQMDAERALPILKRVLAKRDTCSEVLRRKAVFLVAQKRSPETEDILLGAARQDPDQEVREQAVFWLSQVGSERSVTALDSILRNASEPALQEKAIFALAQTRQPRARQVLQEFAGRETAPSEVREQAIFWLGQSHEGDNLDFLRALYGRTTKPEIKEKLIFSLSQNRDAAVQKWLMDVALNPKEDVELRKKALFWAGQSGVGLEDLIALYDRMPEEEMRRQLIFVYSQRREPKAVDKLMQIAKSDSDKELRKQAIFWLSQMKDPRASEFLMQIIEQP